MSTFGKLMQGLGKAADKVVAFLRRNKVTIRGRQISCLAITSVIFGCHLSP